MPSCCSLECRFALVAEKLLLARNQWCPSRGQSQLVRRCHTKSWQCFFFLHVGNLQPMYSKSTQAPCLAPQIFQFMKWKSRKGRELPKNAHILIISGIAFVETIRTNRCQPLLSIFSGRNWSIVLNSSPGPYHLLQSSMVTQRRTM